MAPLVGVITASEIDAARLRHYLLVADKLAAINLECSVERWKADGHTRLLAEVNSLRDQGLLIALTPEDMKVPQDQEFKESTSTVAHAICLRLARAMRSKEVDLETAKEYARLAIAWASFQWRTGTHAIPIASRIDSLLGSTAPTAECDVVNITIRMFPVPSEDVELERFIELKDDPATKSHLLALRHWTVNISRQKLSATEISDVFEHLLDAYNRHYRLHKAKTINRIFGTLICTTAQSIGHLASLRFGDAISELLSLSATKADLAQAEFNGPGAEVAYVVKAAEKLEEWSRDDHNATGVPS